MSTMTYSDDPVWYKTAIQYTQGTKYIFNDLMYELPKIKETINDGDYIIMGLNSTAVINKKDIQDYKHTCLLNGISLQFLWS